MLLMGVADTLAVILSLYFAYALRLDSFSVPFGIGLPWLGLLFAIVVLSLLVFYITGQYRTVVHEMTSRDLNSIFLCLLTTSILLYILSWTLNVFMPRSIPFLFFAFMVLFYGAIRLFIHDIYVFITRVTRTPHVVIYGAGRCGTELAALLQNSFLYYPVAFIDDDVRKKKSILHGLQVYGFEDLGNVLEKYRVEKVLLAIPSIHRSERKKLLERLKDYHVAVLSVPSLVDSIGSNKVDRFALEEIRVEDILGRDTIPPSKDLLFSTTRDKAVMVTGAGGSIGSELCRQILTHGPKRLVLYELSEPALYLIDQELRKTGSSVEIIPCLGDVRNEADMLEKLSSFGIQTVYHAAAYKHVPMVELNVLAGVQNNVFGTWHAAQAAIKAGVERFVLISTDKAVRPANVMGTTKRVAELILQTLSANQKTTCFCMVRFGNVLGSSGSVFPLFRRQIAEGGPVTVTHRDVVRYFMTIPEAVQLVLQASGMAKGGEVFVLDMGAPVKILDMARSMIRLAGKTPKDEEHQDGDIEIRVVGLRPGEKLYEELLVADGAQPTEHPRILCQKEDSLSEEKLLGLLGEISRACEKQDVERVLTLLQSPATGYKPKDGISDLVWKVEHQQQVFNSKLVKVQGAV